MTTNIPFASIRPLQSLDLLSQREMAGMATTDQDIHRLFRQCALAVLNTDGSFTYTPNADWYGNDSFSCTVPVHGGAPEVGNVNVTVTPVNDDAVLDTATTAEDTPVNIDVLDNDNFAVSANPAVTAVTNGSNGTGISG